MQNYNQTLQTNNSSLEEIITQLNNMPDAGGSANPVLQDKTVTPTTSKQTIIADNGYDGLDTVTVNAMPTATQATPTVSINSSTGLVTATATQTAGYVEAGSKSGTLQLAFQAAKTITPGTTNQTAVSSGCYTGGAVTVKGDSNLVAGNIKSGVSIFGVAGHYVGSGSDGVETVTVEIEDDGYAYTSVLSGVVTLSYTDSEGAYIHETSNTSVSHTLEVRKNTMIYMYLTWTCNGSYSIKITGSYEVVKDINSHERVIVVTGDTHVKWNRN